MKINKKKANLELTETVVFVILNSLFFFVLLFFVVLTASSESVKAELYAKKIALAIDSMKLGTELQISTGELERIARKNKFKGEPIIWSNHGITIKLKEGSGYSFNFFTEIKSIEIPLNRKILVIKT